MKPAYEITFSFFSDKTIPVSAFEETLNNLVKNEPMNSIYIPEIDDYIHCKVELKKIKEIK